MSGLDVIELPGQPGMYGRRVLVQAWQAAGSPRVTNGGAGRLYALQKYYWDGWLRRLPGFNPADNPDDESQRLAHVRFAALDIDPTPARIAALSRAGLIRPYSYEPWHWELPNVRQYAIVRALPAPAPAATPDPLEDMMTAHVRLYLYTLNNNLLLVDHLNKTIRELGNQNTYERRQFDSLPYTAIDDRTWTANFKGFAYVTKPNLAPGATA